MARAPTRTKTVEDERDDPIDLALGSERENTAEDLSALLTELTGTTQGDIQVIIYHVPNASGKWQYVKEVQPPIDMPALMEELKAEFGGGAFQLRVRVNGKIKTTRSFDIAKTKALGVHVRPKDSGGDMLQLILAQNASSKSDMMSMFQMMQSQQQQSTNTMMALVTAIIAKPTENPLAILPSLLETMKPREVGGMKEAIETLAAAKGLFGDGGGGGGGDDSLIGMAGKLLPGLLSGATELAKNMGPKPQQEVLRVLPNPQHQQAGPHVPQVPHASGPDISQLTGAEKVLAVLAPDVLFSMQRGHSPEMAADLVLESIEKHGISDDEVSSLVLQFTSLGDQWPQYLTERGIDVTSQERAQWFSQFVGHLVASYQDDGSERHAGGEGDAENHGQAGASGQGEPEGAPTSA